MLISRNQDTRILSSKFISLEIVAVSRIILRHNQTADRQTRLNARKQNTRVEFAASNRLEKSFETSSTRTDRIILLKETRDNLSNY